MNKEKHNEVTPIPEKNAYYERLLDLRRTNPKTFDVISPASKLALYHYESGRRRFFELEAMKREASLAEMP